MNTILEATQSMNVLFVTMGVALVVMVAGYIWAMWDL